MLFPLSPHTPPCNVFVVLNRELIGFIERSVRAHNFDENLFSEHEVEGGRVRSACWTNDLTRSKFRALWDALPGSAEDRQRIHQAINDRQDLSALFNDVSVTISSLDEEVREALADLTKHLYQKTKNLAGIRSEAGQSIGAHFAAFVEANGGSRLCFVCGTARLSQPRDGVGEDDQWRPDYDHILGQSLYPEYGVHPQNLLPTCEVCNSKAKLAKDPISTALGRRLAFFPFPPSLESCSSVLYLQLVLNDLVGKNGENWSDLFESVDIVFPGAAGDEKLTGKIAVWKEVYQVHLRVISEIKSAMIERISSDFSSVDFDQFTADISTAARNVPLDVKKSEWRFWWCCAYRTIEQLGEGGLRNIWAAVEWKRRNSPVQQMANIFGI